MGVRRTGGGWTQAPLRSGGTVQVGGIDLYYEASGPEFGRALLFLHESGGSVATWEQQLLHLGADVRCLALDMPGHGRSDGSPLPSVQAYREWVLGFLEALAIRQKIVVVGLGLGAAVGLDLALVRPDRIEGVVLTGAVPGGRASSRIRALLSQGEAPIAFADELLGPVQSATVRTDWLRRWQKATPAARNADLSAVAQYDWPASLDRVGCPLLFLEGALDSQALIWRRAGARLIQVPSSGVLAPLEQPGRYAAGVREFLATLQRPTDGRAISQFG